MDSLRPSAFQGFSPAACIFLRDLGTNNNKAWFDAHKTEYQEVLLEPFQDLVAAIAPFMAAIDWSFELRPAVGKTLSRIRRDTRFSADKSPYRNTMWATFKRPVKDWMECPAFFFELSCTSYRYGMGFYAAGRRTMDRLRDHLDRSPREFLDVISFFAGQTTFILEGEFYKRALPNRLPSVVQPWYQRKSFYVVCNRQVDGLLFAPELMDELIAGFNMAAPLYHYLEKATRTG